MYGEEVLCKTKPDNDDDDDDDDENGTDDHHDEDCWHLEVILLLFQPKLYLPFAKASSATHNKSSLSRKYRPFI